LVVSALLANKGVHFKRRVMTASDYR